MSGAAACDESRWPPKWYTSRTSLLQELAITTVMSGTSEYGPQLRSLGFRVTAQRMAILHVLRHARGHLSPMEVFARARGSVPGLTQPTVYRTLEFLADNGIVWKTSRPNGHLAYELAESNHNHLVCRGCGSQLRINPAVLEGVYERLEAVSGYAVDHSHLNLSGLCPKCKNNTAEAAGGRREQQVP